MTGFLLALFIAIFTGLVGDRLMKDGMTGGDFVSMLIGLVGAWIGGYTPVFNTFGPSVDSLAIIPAILGSIISVFFLGLSRGILKQVR